MAEPAPRAGTSALFAVTIGVGAFLLFQVQFILGKQILPWFGGAPAVWTTCMLFFQVALLLGYAYAHGLAQLRSAPRQRTIHLVALALAAGLLLLRIGLWPSPITPTDAWKPGAEGSPIADILGLLLFTIGPPFLVLAATGPLLQAWFARACPGTSPYRLYALSNLGSLLGLVTYPFLVETRLPVVGQGWLWSGGFALFALLCAGAAVVAGRAPTSALRYAEEAAGADASPPRPGDRLLWLGLAAIASTMLLGITNQISLEVAVIPFLWMLPLALYLLSFILCFEYERSYHRGVWLPLLGLGAAGVTATLLIGVHVPIAGQLAIDLAALFAYCMVCHGELVRRRPGARHLTAFYLTVAAGGAVGGIFTGVIAPKLFLGLWELPIALVAGILVAWIALRRDPALARRGTPRPRLRAALRVALALYVVALTGALGYHAWYELDDNVFVGRGFFGTLRVDLNPGRESGPYLRLRHGRIIHGIQFVDDDLRLQPNSYYGPESGVGLAIAHRRGDQGREVHLGVVGLGTGTIASYGEAGDRVRFYEIDREVLSLSTATGREPALFTYLSECAAPVKTVLGDARLSLEREADQGFDVLVIDAFSSDAIPAHLITSEAIALYLRHLAADGILALHISNRYLDLDPLVRGLAEAHDLAVIHVGDHRDGDRIWPSDWMLLSRDRSILDEGTRIDANELPESEASAGRPHPVWTDASSNLLEVLRL